MTWSATFGWPKPSTFRDSMSSVPLPPKKVDHSRVAPPLCVRSSFAIHPSLPPLWLVSAAPAVVGKSLDLVSPAMKMSVGDSAATADA